VADGEARTRCGGDLAEVADGPLADPERGSAQFAPAQETGEIAGVDVYRAGSGTEAAAGTGVEAIVGKIGFEIGGISPAAARRDSSRQLTMRWRGERVS